MPPCSASCRKRWQSKKRPTEVVVAELSWLKPGCYCLANLASLTSISTVVIAFLWSSRISCHFLSKPLTLLADCYVTACAFLFAADRICQSVNWQVCRLDCDGAYVAVCISSCSPCFGWIQLLPRWQRQACYCIGTSNKCDRSGTADWSREAALGATAGHSSTRSKNIVVIRQWCHHV